jgi:hypothetical protein
MYHTTLDNNKKFLMSTCGVKLYARLFHITRKLLYIALSTILTLGILIPSNVLAQQVMFSSETSVIPIKSADPIYTPLSLSIKEPGKTIISSPSALENDAITFIDPYIGEAIALIDADSQQQSGITFGYEPKLIYDSLCQEEKAMYDEMRKNALHFNPCSYTVKQHGYEGMDMALVVYGALKTDHPEIENYFMLCEVVDGNMVTALETLYFMPWDTKRHPADATALREEILRFDAVCTRITERMPDEYSTYDKYRYLASVISLITSYDYGGIGGWQNATAYGSIMGGHSICYGYSRGFLYLCQKANLWCETVNGVSGGNMAHMWNIIKLDSGTYYLDITWCDEMGLPGSPEWSRYFMLTQDEILIDHEITDGTVATGMAINLVNMPQQ